MMTASCQRGLRINPSGIYHNGLSLPILPPPSPLPEVMLNGGGRGNGSR